MDTNRLKESFAQVARHGDAVPTYFYGYLFVRAPELRNLFPASMATQRDKLVAALGTVVSNVDTSEQLVAFVRSLGRDHRKFGVLPDHYALVGEALLATLAYHLGNDWTPELAGDWQTAYEIIATEMKNAALDDSSPPWWDAPVVAHERRPGTSIAVITVRPSRALSYIPGQSVGVQFVRRPNVWRYYSPANAPRPDNTLELHVRAVPGGELSPALVFGLAVGDELRLGPPTGRALTLSAAEPGRNVLMLAGGTGLAPLRAMIEQLAVEGADSGRRRVTLIHGSRVAEDLYDMSALTNLQRGRSWFTVHSAVSGGDLSYAGVRGTPVEAALRTGQWSDHEIFVCGPPGMVADTMQRLSEAGVPPQRLHVEEFNAHGYIPSIAPVTAEAR